MEGSPGGGGGVVIGTSYHYLNMRSDQKMTGSGGAPGTGGRPRAGVRSGARGVRHAAKSRPVRGGGARRVYRPRRRRDAGSGQLPAEARRRGGAEARRDPGQDASGAGSLAASARPHRRKRLLERHQPVRVEPLGVEPEVSIFIQSPPPPRRTPALAACEAGVRAFRAGRGLRRRDGEVRGSIRPKTRLKAAEGGWRPRDGAGDATRRGGRARRAQPVRRGCSGQCARARLACSTKRRTRGA